MPLIRGKCGDCLLLLNIITNIYSTNTYFTKIIIALYCFTNIITIVYKGWDPQDSVQLPYKWLYSMVYGRYN